ncbi:probable serine/threonine-protein kinase WNK11 isoform X1 [Olea europaea var. sylvestris]|uniref:probable serine/threonine-protein kinase WNK11 isoform X1 n=1 Tax=Olea europaea var. sylvestris TaxID=158386 RepID=UPI000C1D2D1E|nr:probable serine/threonine-protein kinase WNK11 isoform X1 [Olea europaea var. sylvestris]
MARHSYTSRYGRYSELLGSGAVKRMYRAFEQEEGIEVAWNLIKLISFLGDEAMINRLYSKVRLLRTLKNKNIIALYSVWQDEEINTLNFIIEYTDVDMDAYEMDGKAECSYYVEDMYHGEDGKLTEETSCAYKKISFPWNLYQSLMASS